MVYEEAPRGIKFFDFGQFKPDHTKDNAVLLKMGEKIEAEVLRVEEVEKENAKKEKYIDYKYRLKIKGEDADVIMWSNTSIRGQQEILSIKAGEKIRIFYEKDYPTPHGNKGRSVRIAVDR